MRGLITVAISLLLTAAPGCGGEEGDHQLIDKESQDPRLIRGHHFVSASDSADDAPEWRLPGTHISLSFAKTYPGAGWNTGCNDVGGKVRFRPERVVFVDGSFISTAMLCGPDLMDQEHGFSEFLRSDPTWKLEGDRLTLASGTAVVEFRLTAAKR